MKNKEYIHSALFAKQQKKQTEKKKKRDDDNDAHSFLHIQLDTLS